MYHFKGLEDRLIKELLGKLLKERPDDYDTLRLIEKRLFPGDSRI